MYDGGNNKEVAKVSELIALLMKQNGSPWDGAFLKIILRLFCYSLFFFIFCFCSFMFRARTHTHTHSIFKANINTHRSYFYMYKSNFQQKWITVFTKENLYKSDLDGISSLIRHRGNSIRHFADATKMRKNIINFIVLYFHFT